MFTLSLNKTPVMENIPVYLQMLFLLIVISALLLFYYASGRSTFAVILCIIWLVIQGLLTASGFYLHPEIHPGRFMLLVLPPVLSVLLISFAPLGKRFRNKCSISNLVLFHSIRFPIEIVLLLIYLQHKIPALMTFEQGNLDILSGISAPFIFFLVKNNKLPKWIFLAWNFLCLALLANIVIRAILSAPFPFQAFGFEQPDTAIFSFPFSWLPGFLVPAVLLCHLVTIRKIIERIPVEANAIKQRTVLTK